jgi:hypothetical protein
LDAAAVKRHDGSPDLEEGSALVGLSLGRDEWSSRR